MKHTAEAEVNGRVVTLTYAYPPQIPTGPVDVEITEHKENRSSEANRYYWSLVNAISEINNEPAPVVHNRMLRDYGTPETKGGYNVTVTLSDTQEDYDGLLREMRYHVRPTSQAWTDDETGHPFRVYVLLRGSHTYNTKEMARLINGIVAEAQDAGIETMTPDQRAEMMAAYEQFNG